MSTSNTPPHPRSPRRAWTITLRRLLATLRRGGDLRAAKVRRLRAAVRAKRYENDLKLDVAVERLLGEL
ncbi:MAG TPA: hypothetical protein VFC78_10525 [Tepidisphaeraceae bacterium]|nr:hypothetical protein [Tepidisphaeraceae bacterium]